MNSNSIIVIQKSIRGFVCRRKLQRSTDYMSFQLVLKHLEIYKKYYKDIEFLNQHLIGKKIRYSNFPSEISENIVKFIFFRKYNIMPSWNTKTGDLECMNLILEVKAFSSTGPTTFGPKEKWNFIYFLDATRFQESIFTVFECKIKNTNPIWQQLKVNKHQTYEDQCRQGRRPRLSFCDIYHQLGSNCKMIFKGHINDILKN